MGLRKIFGSLWSVVVSGPRLGSMSPLSRMRVRGQVPGSHKKGAMQGHDQNFIGCVVRGWRMDVEQALPKPALSLI